jgi:uncharacterized protein (DUF433 family)
MDTMVNAIFRNGVFVPTTACDFPENTEVQVFVQGSNQIVPTEKVPMIIDRGRGPEIAGTRITVYDVMDYWKGGWNRESIATLFRLSSREIQVAIDYIEAHRDEVEAGYERILERHRSYRYPPEVQAKLDESHRKFTEYVKRIRSLRGRE